MKKTIAAIFFFLLLISLYRAFNQPTVSHVMDEDVVLSSANQEVRLAPINDSSIHGEEADFEKRILTYARLKEDPFAINPNVMESNYVPSTGTPSKVKEAKPAPKKLRYNFNLEDATGPGDVRIMDTRIGVEYHTSQNYAVGVEASRGIHDTQDASAWGRSIKDENAAQVKYKKFF